MEMTLDRFVLACLFTMAVCRQDVVPARIIGTVNKTDGWSGILYRSNAPVYGGIEVDFTVNITKAEKETCPRPLALFITSVEQMQIPRLTCKDFNATDIKEFLPGALFTLNQFFNCNPIEGVDSTCECKNEFVLPKVFIKAYGQIGVDQCKHNMPALNFSYEIIVKTLKFECDLPQAKSCRDIVPHGLVATNERRTGSQYFYNYVLVEAIAGKWRQAARGCYQYAPELLCNIKYPKCTEGYLYVCRESCEDGFEICFTLIKLLANVHAGIKSACSLFPKYDPKSPDSCFYKRVNCKEPPVVPHATSKLVTQGRFVYEVYKCDPGYDAKGNRSVRCFPDGRWERVAVTCVPHHLSPGAIAAIVFASFVVTAVICILLFTIIWKMKKRPRGRALLLKTQYQSVRNNITIDN